MKRIGFMGLGNMGLPMAVNVKKAGYDVTGFDPKPETVSAAKKAGIETASSAQAVVAGADIVVTMLPSGRHVVEAYTGGNGILATAKTGALLIDCSTIDPASARQVAASAQAAGMFALDAPVSGGVGGAQAGTLTFMVGGDAEAFRLANPVLSAMGKRIVHCGNSGAGQAAKICNNMILGISMIAVSEAFALGDKLGLDRKALFDVASTSSGQCWSLTTYCPVPDIVATSPANNDYKPGFASALMLKDLKLSQDAALLAGAATPLGAMASQIYALMVAQEGGARDFSAVFEFLVGPHDGCAVLSQSVG